MMSIHSTKKILYTNRGSYMNNEQLVNTIKSLCKEHNISITKLEETLGMSQGLISRWNKSDPSLSKIIDIADYFKISLDELTRYRSTINDKFIQKLLTQTASENLKWYNYNNKDNTPKQYRSTIDICNFFSQDNTTEYFDEHIQLSYYTCINNGYISIFVLYKDDNIKTPDDLKLFIQPDNDAQLIFQKYTKEQLIPLWLKILYALKEEAPDELKAEELKNSFINDIDTSSSFKNFRNTDLSGADFSGADLSKSNLSNANLKYANLSGANLEGAILNNIMIDKIFDEIK